MPDKKPRRKRGDPPIRTIDYTVAENGCWVWNWAVHPKGYALIGRAGRSTWAHRISYEMANGPIPPGMVIRHLCGNPSCVNPAHLRAGTLQENARDMVAAGVQGAQKLRPADAAAIRRRYARGGISRRELARRYGVHPVTIEEVIAHATFYDPNYTPPRPKTRPAAVIPDAEQARQIRQLYGNDRKTLQEIADQLGIKLRVVSQIVRNRLCYDPDYAAPERRAVNQKLTLSQAEEIREKIRQGAAMAALAQEYGVGYGTISRIKTGQSHTGIERPRRPRAKKRRKRKVRPTLLSCNGPALTGKAMQAARRQEQAAQRAAAQAAQQQAEQDEQQAAD